MIHRMCETIVHRGPDDEGIHTEGCFGLGMRRLSIIDLVGGHQPIHNEDQTIWIVFNGEIYNFPQLRQDLELKGHRFYTHTDTEVIVHLYEELGSACVEKLRGMFAFGLYDKKREKLLLVRDRLGKKPLHYAIRNGELLFGSEIKVLLEAEPKLNEIDDQGILHYFHFGYIPDPYTAFRAIRKLPPGHVLEFHGGVASVRQYWNLPTFGDGASVSAASEEELLEEFESRLREAVQIRLISDVPLGALLSGGVDSSTIVALMAQASSKPVKTFSIGFENQEFDESKHARLVAQTFGTEHHELLLQPKLEEALAKLTASLEEPFADPSIVPTYYVSRMARQHVTVALSGDGGDELFAGYDRYERYLQQRWLPGLGGAWFRRNLFPHLPARMRGRHFLYHLSLRGEERYLDSISHLPAERDRELFSSDFLQWIDSVPSPADLYHGYLQNAPAKDPLSRLQYLDAKTYLPADVLTKVDRMSMASSLEVRVPLLDHLVVECACRLPAGLKFRGGQKKYFLRRLAERLGVPKQVLERPKQGFAMPLVHWMRDELKQDLLGILIEPKTLQRGYFNPAAVRGLLKEHSEGVRDRSYQIWLLLMFELWHRNFLEAKTRQTDVASTLGMREINSRREQEVSRC